MEISAKNIKRVVKIIRKYQPDIILAPWIVERHPDHENTSKLVSRACFYSGLVKFKTGQEKWRPRVIFYYMMHYSFKPSFVLDITDEFDRKMYKLRRKVDIIPNFVDISRFKPKKRNNKQKVVVLEDGVNKRFSKEARKRAEKFSIEKVLPSYERLFNSII